MFLLFLRANYSCVYNTNTKPEVCAIQDNEELLSTTSKRFYSHFLFKFTQNQLKYR